MAPNSEVKETARDKGQNRESTNPAEVKEAPPDKGHHEVKETAPDKGQNGGSIRKLKEEKKRLIQRVKTLENDLEKAKNKIDSNLLEKIKHLEEELRKAKSHNNGEAKYKATIEHLQDALWLEKARNGVKPKTKSKSVQTVGTDSGREAMKHLKGQCSMDLQRLRSLNGQTESKLKKAQKDLENLALELDGAAFCNRVLERKLCAAEAESARKAAELRRKDELMNDYRLTYDTMVKIHEEDLKMWRKNAEFKSNSAPQMDLNRRFADVGQKPLFGSLIPIRAAESRSHQSEFERHFENRKKRLDDYFPNLSQAEIRQNLVKIRCALGQDAFQRLNFPWLVKQLSSMTGVAPKGRKAVCENPGLPPKSSGLGAIGDEKRSTGDFAKLSKFSVW